MHKGMLQACSVPTVLAKFVYCSVGKISECTIIGEGKLQGCNSYSKYAALVSYHHVSTHGYADMSVAMDTAPSVNEFYMLPGVQVKTLRLEEFPAACMESSSICMHATCREMNC